MSYIVQLKSSAEKELDRLPVSVRKKIISALISLKENPLPKGVKKLQGLFGYRIRIGNYRILYSVDESKKIIDIFAIAHRKDAYRR